MADYRTTTYEGRPRRYNTRDGSDVREIERRTKAMAAAGDTVMSAGLTTNKSRSLTYYAARFMTRPDQVGDIFDRQAFDGFLAEWKADPLDMFPATDGRMLCVWSHDTKTLTSILGYIEADDAYADTKGLLVTATLFDTPEVDRVLKIVEATGCAASLQFAAARGGEYKKGGVNHIREVEMVWECGPVGLGCEPAAGTGDVDEADRIVAEYKMLEQQVARDHPEVFVRDIEKSVAKARSKQRKKAAKQAADDTGPSRCRCGAFLQSPFATVEIEGEDGVGTWSSLGHVAWRTCTNCGLMELRSKSEEMLAQDANQIAKAINADNLRRKVKTDRLLDEFMLDSTEWAARKGRRDPAGALGPGVGVGVLQREARALADELEREITTVSREDISAQITEFERIAKGNV